MHKETIFARVVKSYCTRISLPFRPDGVTVGRPDGVTYTARQKREIGRGHPIEDMATREEYVPGKKGVALA